jgi:hypothetical protein
VKDGVTQFLVFVTLVPQGRNMCHEAIPLVRKDLRSIVTQVTQFS